MQFLNPDGSKKFNFNLATLTGPGMKQYFEERRKVGYGPQASEASLDSLPAMAAASGFIKSLKEDEEADFLLYYVRVSYNNRRFYKIGVTTTTLKQRFGDEYHKIDKIIFAKRVIGALRVEQEVRESFRDHLFPLGIFRGSSGYTEFFDCDVLHLDD